MKVKIEKRMSLLQINRLRIVALIVACLILTNCTSSTVSVENVKPKNTILSHKKGQIDQEFPQKNRSNRQLVNDRAVFKGYKGRGDIIIDSQGTISADIYINGEKLNIAEPLQADTRYHYHLKKRTKNVNNTLKVENVLPEGAKLNITIPYPHLENDTQKYKQSFTQVDALINDDVEQGFPGAVLVVVKNGKIIKLNIRRAANI